MTRDRRDGSETCYSCHWFKERLDGYDSCTNRESTHYGHVLEPYHIACKCFWRRYKDKGSLAEHSKPQNDPKISDLDQLLEWANKNRLYIVISGEDVATVSVTEQGGYRLLAAGPTLLTALARARARYEVTPNYLK